MAYIHITILIIQFQFSAQTGFIYHDGLHQDRQILSEQKSVLKIEAFNVNLAKVYFPPTAVNLQ